MSSPLSIGVDIGSTTVKVALVEPGSPPRVIAKASLPYRSSHPHPGWVEQNPVDWWDCTCRALAAFEPELHRVRAIGITGQGSTFALHGTGGRTLLPAISWQDQRAKDIAVELSSRLGPDLERAHGNGVGDGPEPKMRWALDTIPGLADEASRAVTAAAHIGDLLTGREVISEGDAGSWLCWNRHERRWDPTLSNSMALAHLLPEVAPAGAIVGPVTNQAARHTGLPTSAVVISTTTDLAAAAMSTGAAGPTDLHYSKGTGGFVTAQAVAPANHEPFVILPLGSGELFQYCAGTTSLGSALEWCREITGLPDAAAAAELAEQSKPGAGGVLSLPWLQGTSYPFAEPSARGAFLGLSRSSRGADMIRAVLEATSLEFAGQVRELKALSTRPVDRIIASGGPTTSRLWNSLDASALGEPLFVSARADAAVGAALIAGQARSLWGDPNSTGREMSADLVQVDPNPDLLDGFQEREAVSTAVAAALRPLMPQIAELGRTSLSPPGQPV